MSHLLVFLLATLAWLASVPAGSLDKLARGEKGTVSLFPALPFIPLIAWGLAWHSGRLSFPLGATLLGILHAALLVLFTVIAVRAWLKLRRRDPS